ncbi:MAG: mechanosensitive ion channel protein MscS [Burkholderiales bacterium RIFCSPLOWO2_02_FULL_57_36]|nr:MAG: mechanosensitive ion channel protein MscS [Burkholderiales bacterium RIFCSPLOWO2_02_FULL_57_36]
MDLLNEMKSYSLETSVAVQVFIVVFLTLLLNFIAAKVLNRLHVKLQKTTTPWDDALVDAVRKPFTVLIWIVGIALAAKILQQHTQSVLFEAVNVVRDIGVIVCLGWFLQRFIKRAEKNFIESQKAAGKHVDQTTISAIAKLLRLSVFITVALIILQTLGFSVSGVLAFGGLGGIAIGFASKDLLANFFGALMIYLDRPFAVGDWIRSPDRDIEGTVEHIGWRLTKIRTFDQRPLYLPNATFTTIAVENPSRMTHRRINETIGVRYDDADKVRSIVQDVKEMLQAHPEIDQSQTIIVNFNKFAPSSLDFFIYTFTRTTNWIRYHEVKEDVLLKAMDIIGHHGAEVAFPTSTIHVPGSLRIRTEHEREQFAGS